MDEATVRVPSWSPPRNFTHTLLHEMRPAYGARDYVAEKKRAPILDEIYAEPVMVRLSFKFLFYILGLFQQLFFFESVCPREDALNRRRVSDGFDLDRAFGYFDESSDPGKSKNGTVSSLLAQKQEVVVGVGSTSADSSPPASSVVPAAPPPPGPGGTTRPGGPSGRDCH